MEKLGGGEMKNLHAVILVVSTIALIAVSFAWGVLYQTKFGSREFQTQVIYPTDYIECVVHTDSQGKAISCYRVDK